MSWAQVFVAFFVSHEAGDYLLQTDWQATHKRGGLGADPTARRALFTHTTTYTAAFIPVLIWISSRLGWQALVIAVTISLPHLVQDDGRLLGVYIRRVKGFEPANAPSIAIFVDQSFHFVALLGSALLVTALS